MKNEIYFNKTAYMNIGNYNACLQNLDSSGYCSLFFHVLNFFFIPFGRQSGQQDRPQDWV